MLTVQVMTDGKGKRLTTTEAIECDQPFHQIIDYRPALVRTYTSVQNSKDTSIEEFFLAHLNHHCNPNVVVDMARMELRAIRDIAVGEDLTFFYPSTEWEMAEPFACLCGDAQCLQTISGAKDISLSVLGRYFINRHIGTMALDCLLGSEPALLPVAA